MNLYLLFILLVAIGGLFINNIANARNILFKSVGNGVIVISAVQAAALIYYRDRFGSLRELIFTLIILGIMSIVFYLGSAFLISLMIRRFRLQRRSLYASAANGERKNAFGYWTEISPSAVRERIKAAAPASVARHKAKKEKRKAALDFSPIIRFIASTASAAAGAILSVRKGIAKLFKAILSIRIRPKRRKFVYLEEAYEEDIDVLDVEAESDFPAIHTQRRIIVPQNVLKKAPDMPVKDEKAFETQLHNLQPGGFAQQEDTVIQDSLLDTQSRLAAVKEYKEKVIVEAPKDKYEVMIEKAVQLIGQKKYHLAKQVLSASLATESIVLRKRANMLLLECLIELREHTKARKRLFKVLGSNFDLSADEKMRIKEIMLSLPDMQSAKKPKSVAADDNLNETGGIDVQENASAASEGELPSAPAQIEIVLPETVSEDNESEDLVKDEEVSEAPAVHELQTEDFIKETEAAAEEDDADTQPQLAALEESKEEYNTETQTPKGKYEVMIDKACELISQKKYYLSKQLLAASLASDSVVLRKRSNILMLECMVGLGEYAQARKGLFEVLGGNFDLSPEDKARLKKIMLTIK